MCATAFPSKIIHKRWLRGLHLFYAGLFAFVLPFICWGAQATPGHPHARAHFVFVDPPMSVMLESITGTKPAAHGAHTPDDGSTPLPTPVQLPAGRSVPSALMITLLLLVGTLIAVLPPKSDGPGFFTWFSIPDAAPFYALIPTPPPR
jgi:hypothetical protein